MLSSRFVWGFIAQAFLHASPPPVVSVRTAGTRTFERLWRLPILPEHEEQLKNPYADTCSTGVKMSFVVVGLVSIISRYSNHIPLCSCRDQVQAAGAAHPPQLPSSRNSSMMMSNGPTLTSPALPCCPRYEPVLDEGVSILLSHSSTLG